MPAAQKLLAEVRAKQGTPAETLASRARRRSSRLRTIRRMLAMAGRLSLASGDRAQALAYLAAGVEPETDDAQSQLEIANGYLMAGELDSALEMLEAMPDGRCQRPTSGIRCCCWRCCGRATTRRLMAAVEGDARASPGKDPEVRNLVGSVYAAAGKPDLAREQFDEALKLEPDDPQR